jgi:putative hemolysin
LLGEQGFVATLRLALTLLPPPGAGSLRTLFDRFGQTRGLAGPAPTLARVGALEARIAATRKEIRRAQRLRYRVFFEEGGAVPDPAGRLLRRDLCPFDRVSDHLIVVDEGLRERDGSPGLVGAYRLLRQDVAERQFGFYSSREFDVDALVARRPSLRLLEVGRACVARSHRGKHVLELLWRGLWAYARHHRMDALIGCASLPGAEPAAHATAIRALAESGDPLWRVPPRTGFGGAACEDENASAADARALLRSLPPLVKGYWRLGATFSPTPVVDVAFQTTDLFVALPLADIERRYLQHFGVEPVSPSVAA